MVHVGALIYRLAIGGMLILITIELGATAAAIASSRAGYQVMAMDSTSMEPEINPGDLLVVHPDPASQIRTGDVIIYPTSSASDVLTRRVVQVTPTAQGPAFTTRGDRNPRADPWSIRFDSGFGLRVAYVLPGLGWAYTVARAPGSLIPIGLLVLALLLWFSWFVVGQLSIWGGRGSHSPSTNG